MRQASSALATMITVPSHAAACRPSTKAARAALRRVSASGAGRPSATVLSAANALKSLSLLFQNEVASSLDIPLGFSSADGD